MHELTLSSFLDICVLLVLFLDEEIPFCVCVRSREIRIILGIKVNKTTLHEP